MKSALAFAQKHSLYTVTRNGRFHLFVPGGACSPLWSEAWLAMQADGKTPQVWSGGQLVVSL